MTGENNLDTLIKSMTPELQEGVFVFCTLPPGQKMPQELDPVMSFREKEGLTLILLREEAEAAEIEGIFPCRMITLSIHSALEAVGFTAAITKKTRHRRNWRKPGCGFLSRSPVRAGSKGRVGNGIAARAGSRRPESNQRNFAKRICPYAKTMIVIARSDSDVAIQVKLYSNPGLLRCSRNDGKITY